MRFIVALVLSLVMVVAEFGPSQSTAEAPTPPLQERVNALVGPLIEAEISVGLVVGLIKDGKHSVFAYGRIANDRDATPTADTVYEIGSITKVFTGILLADAIHRGLVKLEDPVADHLPDDVAMPKFGDEPIRLVHLATHTSGLPSLPARFRPKDPNDPYAGFDSKRLYAAVARTKPLSAPGKRYRYSNLGMGLLGHVLVLKNGATSYEQLLTDRVLKPLELSDTKIALTDDMKKRLAPPYSPGGAPRTPWTFGTMAGCGALRSTVNDLIRFVNANMRGVMPDFRDLFPMLGNAQDANGLLSVAPPGGRVVRLGWHRGAYPGVLFHNGGTGGYRSYLAFSRKMGVGVIVLSNTTDRVIDVLGNRILAVLLGYEVSPIEIREPVPVTADVLAKYAGTYQIAPKTTVTVELRRGGLFARLSGQPTWRLFPSSATRFFYLGVKAEMTFHADGDENVTHLVLHQNNRKTKAKRIR